VAHAGLPRLGGRRRPDGAGGRAPGRARRPGRPQPGWRRRDNHPAVAQGAGRQRRRQGPETRQRAAPARGPRAE
jgi:hypothetical protein